MKTRFILLVLILTSCIIAQTQHQSDRLYMKFDPSISFNTTYVSKNEETIALTGLEGIDELNNLYNCTGITRLFEGEDNVLKLWYIFYFDTEEIYSAYEDYNSLTSYITDVDLVSLCEVGLEPNDPLFNSTDHKAFYDSKIPEAWDIETGNSNIIVGIIDLGLDWNHPDISIDNIWQNLGEDANNNGFTIYQDATGNIYFDSGDLNGIDDDGNGRIDDLSGFNFIQYNYNIYSDLAVDQHGLNIFGLIAANANNSIGAAGASFNSKVIFIRTGTNGYITGNWVQAIQYLANMGADIISMSFFGAGFMQSTQDVINYAYQVGSILVACGGYTTTGCPINRITYPVGYDNVIGVGVLENDAINMRLNSIVSSKIDLLLSKTASYPAIIEEQYSYANSMHSSGTTAITSGIVSLLKAHYPTWSNDQIVNQIFSTAINVEEYNQTNSCNFDFTGLIGHGVVDAEYALTFDGTIDRDLIWNKELSLYHDIVVESGKTLTIRDGTNLIFESGKTFNVYGNLIIEGDLIINQSINILNGGSLQILPGATITFTNNSSLVVNGVLNAVGTSSNKITFTSQSGTTHSSWGSITFDGPGASGSILEYVNVQYGTRVEAINTSNITIQNCNLTDTYDGIRFYASSGSIRNNVISTNSIGHGIIIEQSSTATCEQNVLTKTSSPRTGVGILYRGGASGTIWQNDINGWDWGIGAIWGSSPDFRPNPLVPQNRNNRVTNCRIGVDVYNNSWPIVGLATTGFGYNSIYTNEYKNVYFTSGGTLYALQNYWGGRPTSSMFYLGSDCVINTDAWLKKNPWQLYSDLEISSTTKNEDEESLLNSTVNDPALIIESMSEGIKLRIEEKFADAKDFFISYISQYPEKQAAYVELYKCYAGETENDLINYFSSLPDKTSNEQKMLLSYMYLKQNNIELAKTINDEIISENPDTKLEAEAKINNVYISLYNENNFDAAVAIFNEVLQKPNLSTDLELSLVQQSIESYARLHNLTTPVFNLPKENPLNNGIPDSYSLFVNYPNPFNPSTRISYTIKEAGLVKLKVFDILGSEVAVLVNETKEAGYHSVEFNASNLPSGVYIYTLQVNGFTNSKKMLLLK